MSTATTDRAPARRTEVLRLPRTTGALSGLLILLLGVWGGLIPFVGPYFHYAFGGYQHWHFTNQRLWLEIVPGAVAVVGGLMLMRASTRVGGLTAGWVAVAAGAWFAVGPSVSILWHHTIYAIGAPMGGDTRQMLEWVGYFYGLGALIIGLAAFAMGRYFSRPRIVTEAAALAEAPIARHDAVAEDRAPVAGRTAVADRAPVADERAPIAEGRTPVADRGAVADEPATVADRGAVAGEPATVADRGAVAGEPATVADRGAVAGEPATVADRGAVADEPATVADRAPVADEPAAGTGAAPGGAAYPASTSTTRRRQGGLFGRWRRS
jgi:hypothetical protein